MDRVKLGNRLVVRVVITFGTQGPLANVNDHEGHIHSAFDHLRQVDLRREAHRVIAIRREVSRIDIIVRVELDYPIVDRSSFSDQCSFRLRLD